MHDLMTGVNAGLVGGPALDVAPAPAAAIAPAGLGRPVRLVAFRADSEEHQIMTREPKVLTATLWARSAFAGPLVGIAQFGSGNAAASQIEFDIPSAVNLARTTFGSAVQISVPADYLEISARNDANLIPRAGDDPIGAGIVTVPQVTANIAVGVRAGGVPVLRTVYGVFSAAGGLAPAASALVPIPSGAVRCRVFRFDAGNTVEVTQTKATTLTAIDGPVALAADAPSPTISLAAGADILEILNTGGAAIRVLGAVFEIAL